MKRLLKRAAGLIFSPDYARLAGTRRLLRTTDHSDQDIAELTGFGSACEFRKAFIHQYGATPRTYRRCLGAHDRFGQPAGITPGV